jgi:hypothetical protein
VAGVKVNPVAMPDFHQSAQAASSI